MVLTTQDFLIKAGFLVAAIAVSTLHWSITMNPDEGSLFHLGHLLPFVIVVPIVAIIPGALFFGVAALTMDRRTRDDTRACFLMGLYVVALLLVCFNVIRIADIPRPPAAKGGGIFYWYVAYVFAFIYSSPGVGLTRTQQQIDQQKAHEQQIAQRPGINRWLLVGGSSLLACIALFLIFGGLTEPRFALAVSGMIGVSFAMILGLGMLLFDYLDGRLRLWKITFPRLVRGKTSRSKTRDWSAMSKALIDSKNWNGLLLLTDAWLTAERGGRECWASKGLAHEMMGDFHKAIPAYQMSLWVRYDETVAKRLEETERKQQTQAREERERKAKAGGDHAREKRERKAKAEDERAREQRARDSNANWEWEFTGGGRSQNRTSFDNYFRILEIQPGATIKEVKAAYKRQMQQYHPDKVASLGKELRDLAEGKSKEINAAYRAIMDALGA